MFHGWQFGVNDRRICPDCEQECPETARVCPHCGRRFRQLYPPALGRGYVFPFAVGGGPLLGLTGHWLGLPPAAMKYVLALPPIVFFVAMEWLVGRGYSAWPTAGLWERALILLIVLGGLAAFMILTYVSGFWFYYHGF